MFRRIAGILPGGAQTLFRLHPVELHALLELAWELRLHEATEVGRPNRRSELPELPGHLLSLIGDPQAPAPGNFIAQNRALFTSTVGGAAAGSVQWDHLIYAYMVENTGIYEIFRTILFELLHGEKLGVPTVDSQLWLRTTEEVFFADPASFFIGNLRSRLRPDLDATRRNAYYRMFGMDLNHGADLKYNKPDASNLGFVALFEDFCRSVWEGISNVSNSSGADPTDNAAIANLAQQLHNMLTARRQYGNLAREEFYFVAMMSWFHLSIEFNAPIVVDLRSEAFSAEQRLFKLGEKAQKPAHKLSKSFFDLADALSLILTQIETGIYNDEVAVPALYTTVAGGGPEVAMRTIITHWSIVTGRNLRVRTAPVAVHN